MKFHPCCSILHISFLLRLCNSPLLMNTTFFFHLFRGILFTFLPPFPSSNPLIYSTFHFKFTASFLINCYYILMFICIYTYIHISKYNLLNPYSTICMYIFRDDHLALDNWLLWLSLGRTPSLTPIFTSLPVVLMNHIFHSFIQLWKPGLVSGC